MIALREAEPVEIEEMLTIDGLAAATGMPARTIRYYQTVGLMPPPLRRGRVGYYSPAHTRRLQAIAVLKERGLSLDAISRTAADAESRNLPVETWVEMLDEARPDWGTELPRRLTLDQAHAEIGDDDAIDVLQRSGIVSQDRSGWVDVPHPPLLDACLRLVEAGFALEPVATAFGLLLRHLDSAALDIVETTGLSRGLLSSSPPAEAAALAGQLRQVTAIAAGKVLLERIDHELAVRAEAMRSLDRRVAPSEERSPVSGTQDD